MMSGELPPIQNYNSGNSGGTGSSPVYEQAKPSEFYDIDTGIKTSLAKRVARA